MKVLEFEQLETIQGGGFRWECAGYALGIGISIADGVWILAAYLVYEFTEAGCQND